MEMTDRSLERPLIGLVGLGNMGQAIASRLVTIGNVVGVDLSEERRKDAERLGVKVSADLPALSEAKVVVLSLPTPAASASVVKELAQILQSGATVIETSTLNQPDVVGNASVLAEQNIRMFDIAILSGVGDMQAGVTTLLAGATEDELVDIQPILEVLGSQVIPFGKLGAGMVAKVVNNAVAHAVMVVLAEASAMAQSSGVELTQLVELLKSPDAGLMRPLTHRLGERVLHGSYDGGMPTDAARKDSVLALSMAQAQGVPLFVIQAAHTVYEMACAQGLGRMDYAVIAQMWDSWGLVQKEEEN